MNREISETGVHKGKINNKPLASVLFGFLLINLKELLLFIHPVLQTIAVSIGLFLIFINPFRYGLRFKNNLRGWVKYVYIIYLIWLIVIALVPVFSGQNYSYHSYHPYSRYGLFSYMIPFIGLFGIGFVSFKDIFKYAAVFSIAGLVSFAIGFNDIQSAVIEGILRSTGEGQTLGEIAATYFGWFIISSLTILCLEFVDKDYKRIAVFTMFFCAILMLMMGRRGSTVMLGLYSIGAIYLYMLRSSARAFGLKVFVLIVGVILLAVTISNLADSSFNIFFDRISDDTRSTVDIALVKYLTNENAWLFGKGIEGAYRHDGFEEPRYVHETGYLYLILKGGIVNLFLFLALLSHAAWKGFFRSRNRLVKGMSIYVFLHMFYLIPFGIPTFTIEYVYLWISFVCCESQYLCSLSNDEIKQYIYFEKYYSK